MLAKALNTRQRRLTMGAHTSGTESIVDHMQDEGMIAQGLSHKRWLMLFIFFLAMYINEVPLSASTFGASVYTGSLIEQFMYFPLFYMTVHWLEEVGLYQTMLFAMVFQTFSILISKTADEG